MPYRCLIVIVTAALLGACGGDNPSPPSGSDSDVESDTGMTDDASGDVGDGSDTSDQGAADAVVVPVADSCTPNPCVFGSCRESGGSAFCTCQVGWGGPACDTPVEHTDYCAQGPCERGVCVNGHDGFACECEYGFGGELCSESIDVEDFCAESPCANGDCINQNDGAECDCHWGWGGATCDDEVNACDPDPCVNGVCSPSRDGAVCICDSGWGGPLCNGRLDDGACLGLDCGQGRCENTLSGGVCVCDSGWGGSGCDVEVDDPCAPNPCENGRCVAAGESFTCDCTGGYEGDLCGDAIAGVTPNPVYTINGCPIEVPSPGGWIENDDGTLTAAHRFAFDAGGIALEFEGTSITYDPVEQSFSGFLDRLPLTMGWGALAGAVLGTPDELIIHAEVMTGAEMIEQAGRVLPFPADYEALAITFNVEGMTIDLPILDEPVEIAETNLFGVYIDPCDPMVVLSIKQAVLSRLPAAITAFGGSANGNLELSSEIDIWEGEMGIDGPVLVPRTVSGGHLYLAGFVSLKPLKIPLTVSGDRLHNNDPDGNGEFLDHHLRTILDGGWPDEFIPPEVDDFIYLTNGRIRPAIPLAGVVEGVLSDISEFLGFEEISLDLAEGTMILENTDARGFGLYFRGTSTANVFADTPLGLFGPAGETDLMGYIRALDDFGLAWSKSARLFTGSPVVNFAVSFLVRGGLPEVAAEGTVELGAIDLSDLEFLPVDEIDLGEVVLRFFVDFNDASICGETGYEGIGFECTVEVCIGETGFDFTPTCALPRNAPCFSDDMCISGACSSVIPDSVCIDACDTVRSGCEPRCETTRDVCEGGCGTANEVCEGFCRTGGAATCAAGCALDDLSCQACDTTEASCRTVGCDAAALACEAGCTADRVDCSVLDCGPQALACAARCASETGICGAGCVYDDAQCRIDRCVAGEDSCLSTCAAVISECIGTCAVSLGCDVARDTCRLGCDTCITFPELCPEGRNGCLNQCDSDFAFCAGDCASACPLESECLNGCAQCNEECALDTAGCFETCGEICQQSCYPGECEAGCQSEETSCVSGCTGTRNGCYGTCASARSSCQVSNCGAEGASCLAECASCEDQCPSAPDCIRDTCGPPCSDACDVERDLCLTACDLVTACE